MSKSRNAREFALKVLFQIEVGKLPPEEALEVSFEEARPPEGDRPFIEEIVRGVIAQEADLDQVIEALAEGWRLDRLAKVDKNVLRMALYELKHHPELPVSMVINDAVEIAKKYSTDDSGRFVNGILGSYLRERGDTPAAGEAGERGNARD
jgi:transcription antitermination protein NusB